MRGVRGIGPTSLIGDGPGYENWCQKDEGCPRLSVFVLSLRLKRFAQYR